MGLCGTYQLRAIADRQQSPGLADQTDGKRDCTSGAAVRFLVCRGRPIDR